MWCVENIKTNSVKRSDVTGNRFEWQVKTKLYNTPFPYFIVVASSVKILEGKANESHRIERLEKLLAERKTTLMVLNMFKANREVAWSNLNETKNDRSSRTWI